MEITVKLTRDEALVLIDVLLTEEGAFQASKLSVDVERLRQKLLDASLE